MFSSNIRFSALCTADGERLVKGHQLGIPSNVGKSINSKRPSKTTSQLWEISRQRRISASTSLFLLGQSLPRYRKICQEVVSLLLFQIEFRISVLISYSR